MDANLDLAGVPVDIVWVDIILLFDEAKQWMLAVDRTQMVTAWRRHRPG